RVASCPAHFQRQATALGRLRALPQNQCHLPDLESGGGSRPWRGLNSSAHQEASHQLAGSRRMERHVGQLWNQGRYVWVRDEADCRRTERLWLTSNKLRTYFVLSNFM